jgi:hypothetical protein
MDGSLEGTCNGIMDGDCEGIMDGSLACDSLSARLLSSEKAKRKINHIRT